MGLCFGHRLELNEQAFRTVDHPDFFDFVFQFLIFPLQSGHSGLLYASHSDAAEKHLPVDRLFNYQYTAALYFFGDLVGNIRFYQQNGVAKCFADSGRQIGTKFVRQRGID